MSRRILRAPASRSWLCVAFFLIVATAAGCGKTDLVVKVGPIPDAATALRVLIAVDEVESADLPSYALPPVGQDGRISFTFGARILDRTAGSAELAVAAVSDAGCIVATGTGQVPELSQPPAETLVVLVPTPANDAASCASAAAEQRPQLFAAAQHLPVSGVGERYLELSGWGFARGVTVSIDGRPAEELRRESPIKLRTALPILTDPSGVQSILIRATNPDGQSSQLSALLTVPLFSTTNSLLYQPALTNTTPIFAGLAVADLSGNSAARRLRS